MIPKTADCRNMPSESGCTVTYQGSVLTGLAILALTALSAISLVAQVDSAPPKDPADTVVARFGLPSGVLADVSTSTDLVAALREHLVVDAALPLDESFAISLAGFAGDDSGIPYTFTLSSLGMRLDRGAAPLVDFPYATAVRESHGDDFPPDHDEWDEIDDDEWNEEDAWGKLVEALDVGLPQSSEQWDRGEGHVHVRVEAVHEIAWDDYEFEESLEGAVLKLMPSPFFSSQLDVELPTDIRGLVIELEPVS